MATAPGGTKEKSQVETFSGDGIRFQGTIRMPDGRRWQDRTTLTPLPDGRVQQLIEISLDGGENWKTTFEAHYIQK